MQLIYVPLVARFRCSWLRLAAGLGFAAKSHPRTHPPISSAIRAVLPLFIIAKLESFVQGRVSNIIHYCTSLKNTWIIPESYHCYRHMLGPWLLVPNFAFFWFSVLSRTLFAKGLILLWQCDYSKKIYEEGISTFLFAMSSLRAILSAKYAIG